MDFSVEFFKNSKILKNKRSYSKNSDEYKNKLLKRGLHPMLKYRRFSNEKNLLSDGSRKIKKIPKCRELSYLGNLLFIFLKKKFHFLKK